jgi:hypothetical protein
MPLPGPDATGDELFRMGLLYSTGRAARRWTSSRRTCCSTWPRCAGSEEAKTYRRELSAEMDRDDIAEAQRAARRWIDAA